MSIFKDIGKFVETNIQSTIDVGEKVVQSTIDVGEKALSIFKISDQKIYIANHSSKSIYVLPTPNADYVWGDIGFTAASSVLVTVASGGTAAPAVGGVISKTVDAIKSIDAFTKLIKAANVISALSNTYDWYKAGKDLYINSALKELEKAKEFLDKNALVIKPGEVKRVIDTNIWPYSYLSPSGWAAQLTGSDISLFVIDSSLSSMIKFNSNSDYSWIVKNNEIVRAKKGTLEEESKQDGFYYFSKGDSLYAPQFLLPEQSLSSSNGKYVFCSQTDGNAVIYKCDGTDKEAIWATDTNGRQTGKAIMQPDGNLVIYDRENKVIWATDKNLGTGHEYQTSKLIMQNDGNLVVYNGNNKPLWASKDSRGVKH